jgi:hypothetical protein
MYVPEIVAITEITLVCLENEFISYRNLFIVFFNYNLIFVCSCSYGPDLGSGRGACSGPGSGSGPGAG